MRRAQLVTLGVVLSSACLSEEARRLPDTSGMRSLLVVPLISGPVLAQALEVGAQSAAAVALPDGGAELVVALYRRPLAELGLEPGPLPLVVDECGPPLPAPDAVHRQALGPAGEAPGWSPLPPAELVRRVRGVPEPGPPRLVLADGEFTAALSCAPPCDTRATQQGGTIEIAPGACLPTTLKASVDSAGNACFSPNTDLGRCTEEPPGPGVALAARCEGGSLGPCAIDVLAVSAPAVEARMKELHRGAPDLTRGFDRPAPGYLGDLTVLRSGAIALIDHEGPTRWYCVDEAEQRPLPLPPPRVLFLDPERMEVVHSSTAPPCLNLIEAEPARDGYLGVHVDNTPGGDASRVQLARYDERGRLVSRIASSVERGDHQWPQSLAVSEDGAFAVLVVGNVRPGAATSLVVIDLRMEPAELHPVELGQSAVREVRMLGGGRFAVVDESNAGAERFLVYALDSRAIVGGGVVLEEVRRMDADLGDVLQDPSGVYLMSIAGAAGGVLSFVGDRPVQLVRPSLHRGNAFSLARWPGGQGRYAVGLSPYLRSAGEGGPGAVGFVDLAPGGEGGLRWFPGVVHLLDGVVGRLELDPRGRVWVTQPGRGVLWRLSPR